MKSLEADHNDRAPECVRIPVRICTILVALALSGCGIPTGVEMWLQTKRYFGNGTIRTCNNLLAPGYAIEFPTFDASKDYAASYRLSHVPQVYGILESRNPYIYLCFYWKRGSADTDQIKSTVTASFRATLVRSSGQIVHSIEVPLARTTWGEARDLHVIADFEQAKFHFDRNSDYLLRVSYTPGLVPPPAKKLFFAIKDCAEY